MFELKAGKLLRPLREVGIASGHVIERPGSRDFVDGRVE